MPYKDKNKRDEFHKGYYKKNIVEIKAQKRKIYKKNSREIRSNILKSLYGITLNEKELMIKAQNNKCAICGVIFSEGDKRKRGWCCVDHNHITGAIRGILCGNCNHGIGKFKENKYILENAIDYLERYK